MRMPENGGTYKIRNHAIPLSRGSFITFQDSDDWAHPERIERQVAPLLEPTGLVATHARGARMYPDLSIVKVGYSTFRMAAASLMFRKDVVLRALGGFDETRKAADTEFAERLKTVFGEEALLDLPDVLVFTQLTEGSLSRADFAFGWHHGSRVVYADARRYWHREIEAGRASAMLEPGGPRRFPAPERFITGRETPPKTCDVLWISDWRSGIWRYDGASAQVEAVAAAGMSTVVAHATVGEARRPRPPPQGRRHHAAGGRGADALRHLGRAAACARHDRHRPRAAVVVAAAGLGRDVRRSDRHRRRLFAREAPRPVADLRPRRDRAERRADVRVAAGVAAGARRHRRRPARARRHRHDPAVATVPGRAERAAAPVHRGARRFPPHRRHHGTRAAAPRSSVLGGAAQATAARRRLRRPDARRSARSSARCWRIAGFHRAGWSWTSRRRSRAFLRQLDVFVAIPPRSLGPVLPWSAVAAMAEGAVVVISPAFRPHLGDAALYVPAADVHDELKALAADPERLVGAARARVRVLSRRAVGGSHGGPGHRARRPHAGEALTPVLDAERGALGLRHQLGELRVLAHDLRDERAVRQHRAVHGRGSSPAPSPRAWRRSRCPRTGRRPGCAGWRIRRRSRGSRGSRPARRRR